MQAELVELLASPARGDSEGDDSPAEGRAALREERRKIDDRRGKMDWRSMFELGRSGTF